MEYACHLCGREFTWEKTLLNHKCSYCQQCETLFSTFQRYSTHTCTIGEPPSTIKNRHADGLQTKEIVEPDSYITDDVVNRVLELMAQQWPEVNIAFRLPSEAEVLRRQSATADIQLVPVNQHAVNIHYLDRHWLTSWQDPCDLTVKVYDSKQDKNRLMRLLPILRKVYDMKVYSPRYIAASQQQEAACGAFAAAFAVCCAEHKPPEAFKFNPDSEMRHHLEQCIINCEMTMFPYQSGTGNSVTSGTSDSMTSGNSNSVTCGTSNSVHFRTNSVLNILDEIERQKQLQHEKAKRMSEVNQGQNLVRNVKKQVIYKSKRICEEGAIRTKRLQCQKERQTKVRERECENLKTRRLGQQKERQTKVRERECESLRKRRLGQQKERQTKVRDSKSDRDKKRRSQVEQERLKKRREHESESLKKRRSQVEQERLKKRREHESESQKKRRSQVEHERLKKRREHESESLKKRRLCQQKKRQTMVRDSKSDRDKKRRSQVEQERLKKRREHESESLKKRRLGQQKERQTMVRDSKSDRDKKRRSQVEHERLKKRREHESESLKKRRLCQQKKRQTMVRDSKSDRDKKRRSQVEHERLKKRRENESESQRQSRRVIDKQLHTQCRHPQSIDKGTQQFRKEILKSPEYVCTVCHRTMYKENVIQYSAGSFRNSDLADFCRTNIKTVSEKEWICTTCQRHLKKGSTPPQAQVNDMALPEEPSILNELTDFESRLVAKRIPFMKLTALPRGRQRGIVGSVVNVPSDVDETCNILPRTPTSAGIIPVKLKRKQEYKSHVYYEHVRPNVVLEALRWLKENNHHYAEVIDASEKWEETFTIEDSDLWNHLTQPEPDSSVSETASVIEDNVGDESEVATHEHEQVPEANADRPLDTCIQISDIALDVSKAISISPGEGNTPIGLMTDTGCEELSFPKLFPTGRFGFDTQRERKITPKKYFNARILNHTGKFASNTEYLFFAQYITEYKQVWDNISIALRKTHSRTESGQSLTSSMVQNAETLASFISKDRAYQFLQTVRGSPPYWQKAMYKLLAAVKQFGIFTFFVTLSSADLKWHDTLQAISRQQGRPLTDDEVDCLTYEEKTTLLRSNPVTAARHFDHRLQSFFRLFLLSPAEPLGKITHYSYRIEFQQRGSPHAHIVLWVEDSPSPHDKDEVICDFIDQFVSCRIPDAEEDPELHKLVTTVQQHHHTATCRKKGTVCRFSFPKLPSKTTVLARKLEIEDVEEAQRLQEKGKKVLTKVHEVLQENNTSFPTVEELVETLDVSMEEYTSALKLSSRGSTVVLQRAPVETHTNYYNEHLLRAWGANIDVQFCLDPYACIMYMVAYITKDEREMSQILHSVSKECSDFGWKQNMKNCAKAFLNAREVSAQEAVYRLLSFPLFKCNFRTVFVPADLPKKRVVFLKPLSVISAMDDEEEDIFQKSIIDKYALRPTSLANICLAYFAVWYVTLYKTGTDGNDDSGSDDDDDQGEKSSETIALQDGVSYMKKTSNPAVLRYHKKSEQKAPEEYYYGQILLFLPWTKEEELLSLPSYQEHFQTHETTIETNRSSLEHHTDLIEAALKDFEENGPPRHAFDEISPAVEQDQSEMLEEGVELDPEAAILQPLPEHEKSVNSAIDSVPGKPISYSIEMRPGVLPDTDYHTLVQSLNEKQRDVYQHLLNWCSNMSKKHKTGITPEQLCLFVSGGAGTGKSHLISALYQMAVRTLQVVGDNPDDVRVTLTAPTGSAAHNISGVTLHAAFLLPLGQTKSYVRLSDEKRNGLRSKAGKLQLLIIDEISMVSCNILLQIHNRLCEIKGVTEPFGGISVIVFGDLYQLPPVLQPFVFKPGSDVIANLTGSLWRLFFYKELEEIMRQKDDMDFALLLNRVRTAQHTDEDIKFLKSREIHVDESHPNYPRDTLHVFAQNSAVDQYNNSMLDSLETAKVTIVAVDRKPAALEKYDVNSDSRFTGGLASVIRMAVDAKVMLIRNIDVMDGLVNGAQGTVVGMTRSGAEVSILLIHFNNPVVGAKTRATTKHITEARKFPEATPIERSEISFTVNKKNRGLTITRCQFPLKLAWACTIHKVQGLTVSKIVVSFKHRFNDGQAYVALSRVRSADGLFLLDFDPAKIRASNAVLEEMGFLTEERSLVPYGSLSADDSASVMSLLNVRSLTNHSADVLKDPSFLMSDVVVLTETWLSGTIDSYTLLPDRQYSVQRADRQPPGSVHRSAGGVLVAVKMPYQMTVSRKYTSQYIQIIMVHISDILQKGIYALAVYNSPDRRNCPESLLQQMRAMLATIPHNQPCVIVGDMNEDAIATTHGPIQTALQSMNFQQVVQSPTHRHGACLDHIYTRNVDCVDTCVSATYYSDHHWASCNLKF